MKASLGWSAVSLMVAAVLAAPPRVEAGQKEWANAGKILTGVVVGGAVMYMLPPRQVQAADCRDRQPASGHRWEERRYVSRRAAPCPPPVVYYPVVVEQHCAPPPPPPQPCAPPQRILPSPGPGYPALLQVWSDVECRWVTVSTYPGAW